VGRCDGSPTARRVRIGIRFGRDVVPPPPCPVRYGQGKRAARLSGRPYKEWILTNLVRTNLSGWKNRYGGISGCAVIPAVEENDELRDWGLWELPTTHRNALGER